MKIINTSNTKLSISTDRGDDFSFGSNMVFNISTMTKKAFLSLNHHLSHGVHFLFIDDNEAELPIKIEIPKKPKEIVDNPPRIIFDNVSEDSSDIADEPDKIGMENYQEPVISDNINDKIPFDEKRTKIEWLDYLKGQTVDVLKDVCSVKKIKTSPKWIKKNYVDAVFAWIEKENLVNF